MVTKALKFNVILYTHVISIRVYMSVYVYVYAGLLNYEAVIQTSSLLVAGK